MTILWFLLLLGIVVFIHEFGHFIFAKRAGIYVYEFSLGMGPRLFKFKRKNDETEYSIRLLPIGGYVQMAGESVEEDKNIPIEKNMQSKTWLQKFLVVVAGITFNFILAIVIFFAIGLTNGSPINKPVVSTIVDGEPAFKAGLSSGDKIIGINGINIKTSDRLLLEMQVSYGKKITLKVKNNEGVVEEISITPDKLTDEEGNVSYKYGFNLENKFEKGFLPALKYAFTKFIGLLGQMLLIIWYLITGKLSISNLSGPIGIFNVVQLSVAEGFINFVYLVGYISLNLGFMNLLPIPALDGGRLLFLIIEKIIGRPLNPKVENIIHTIGFSLLMLLIIVVSYNDILKLFS